jgi:hypothetical protein
VDSYTILEKKNVNAVQTAAEISGTPPPTYVRVLQLHGKFGADVTV